MAEKFDVKGAIEALVKEKWDDNESQGRAVNILKGLAFSDEKMANDFMHDLHSAALTISKKILKEAAEVKTESIEEKASLILEGVTDDKLGEVKKDKDIDHINNLL